MPGFRSRNGGRFWCVCGGWLVLCEAQAAWKLANFMGTHTQEVGKRLVYINLDETCIRMYIESRTPGLVRVPSGARKVNVLEKKLKAPLSQQRSAVSLIACATDDEEAARLLP